MKQMLAFLVILAIILAVGYYSVGSADLISKSHQLEQTKIPRNREESNAAYIAGEETGFDPMSILEAPSSVTITPSDYHAIRNICTAILLVLSHYDENAECPDSFADELSDSLLFCSNGYVYTEKFEYENVNGQKRYIDCIFTADNYRLTYLRFYSPENYEISSDETETALEAFDKDSTFFYSSTGNDAEKFLIINGGGDGIFADSPNDSEFDYNIGRDDSFDQIYNHLKYLYDSTEIVSDSKMMNFWLKSCMLSRCTVNDASYNLSCIAHIVSGIMMNDRYFEPKYTIYQGRIYQTVQFRGSRLITIYNIAEDQIEGFFAP